MEDYWEDIRNGRKQSSWNI